MPTKKQLSNLRRGGVPATAAAARRAREAKAAHASEEARLAELARGNPDAALVELWVDMARGVKRLTRRWLSAGGDPSRELVNAWRECRMLTAEVADLLRDRGGGSDAFFATLESHLRNANLSGGPRPYLEPEKVADG